MIRSMTGYGRGQQTLGGMDITVEIRSVNHRYYEYSSRLPRVYGFLDERLKGYLQKAVSRGKVDVGVWIDTVDAPGSEVVVNHALAEGYLKALHELAQTYGLRDDVSVNTLSRFPDILTVRKAAEDEEAIWEAVRQVADEALAGFVAMREREGAKLRADVEEKLARIESLVTNVEAAAPETAAAYEARLRQKLEAVLAAADIDESRIIAEAAIYADHVAVDEETVRLRSHIASFRDILGAFNGPIGRKLDFLVQEMNREANTIGSKAQDAATAQVVVEIKSDIEKIREQIQNIE